MRILFICEGKTVPATRFRVEQYLPYFRQEGHDCTVRYGYGTRYNQIMQSRWRGAYKAASALKKLAALRDVATFDLLVLQRSIVPFDATIEGVLARLGVPFVFDFDDAVHLGAGGVPNTRRARTLARVAAAATRVVSGNAYLAQRAGQPNKTVVVPTGIETTRYVPRPLPSREIVVGWIGTASNLPFVREILPGLLAVVRANSNVRLRLVSNGRLSELEGIERVEQRPWSSASEIEELQSFDIGLMPLSDTELARGKCAFKIIQYMSVGIPTVASRVGANVDVLDGSEAGLLVRPGESWEPALEALIGNSGLRASMGSAGRSGAVARFDASRIAQQYLRVFKDAVK